MYKAKAAPIELVPTEKLPPREVHLGRLSLHDCSDIFPQAPEDLTGELGDYRGGDPAENSPLYPILQGVQSYRYAFLDRLKEEKQDTEAIKGQGATTLQLDLVRHINRGWLNLLERSYSQEEAVGRIRGHIASKHQDVKKEYNDAIDLLAIDQAADERRDPISLGWNLTLSTSLSMEDQRQIRVGARSGEIGRLKIRQLRLEFEWLSATAITAMLANHVSRSSARQKS